MIKNGLYALNATSRDGIADAVGGILILRDGQVCGGDSFVCYSGSYECSAGNWQGKLTSQEHTPTGRPMAERVQSIGFLGTYNVRRSMQWRTLASIRFDIMRLCVFCMRFSSPLETRGCCRGIFRHWT
jgi:hypothetical protein